MNTKQKIKIREIDAKLLEAELHRERHNHKKRAVLRSTLFMLITVAAIAVLVATLWMPVLQIYGSSMTPTLSDGQIVISIKGSEIKHNDIIAFYYNNKVLVKRVIAVSGDWVNIDEDGNVYVNNRKINEPYVTEKSLGNCDIELPYQVPDEKYFMMGDHRLVSVDSRSSLVGAVSQEQIVGKIVFSCWPLDEIGVIK